MDVNEPRTSGRRARILNVLATFALVFLVFLIGVWVGGHPRQTGVDRLPTALRDRLIDEDRTALATQVLAILKADYYKPIDTKISDLEDASVGALVKEVGDPYTEYLDPDSFKDFKANREGKFGGVGVEWHPEGDDAVIVAVVPGAPAADAGILAKDRVVAVDGTAVTAKDRFAAMENVRGDEGTKVTLRIARTGAAEKDYTMTREEIRRKVTESRVETVAGEKIGYVALEQFTEGSARAFRNEVRRLTEQKVTGVVFDLRGDGGGLVNEATGVAGAFLADDTTVATTRGRSGPRDTLKTDGQPVNTQLPLVVLVDQNSASASEIVAGALRDAERARLVGTRTFGKALIQSTRSLANGGAIKFTIASYLTPRGFDLSTKGLPPDIEVADDPKTPDVDEALQRALTEAAAS